MQIQFQFKTANSAIENCPCRYRVTSAEGGYVIQGKKLSGETRAQLRQLGLDEDAVWVPDDVIERDA
jgi:hypothetical protein